MSGATEGRTRGRVVVAITVLYADSTGGMDLSSVAP